MPWRAARVGSDVGPAVDEPHTHPKDSDDAVAEAVGKDALVISDTKVISGDVSATGIDVRAGGVLEFDPARSTTLTVTGNVVVRGRLRMRPNDPDVVHRLQFADVDESAFVGDTMGPVASDVGLWVIGAGRLDLMGSRRRGWNRRGTHPTWRRATRCCAPRSRPATTTPGPRTRPVPHCRA